jgi:hypothetical protein
MDVVQIESKIKRFLEEEDFAPQHVIDWLVTAELLHGISVNAEGETFVHVKLTTGQVTTVEGEDLTFCLAYVLSELLESIGEPVDSSGPMGTVIPLFQKRISPDHPTMTPRSP